MDSILTSIKKMLGITEEYTHFDSDLIIHINTALGILTQLGVGPSRGYLIKDKSGSWSDFVGCDSRLEFIKSYVHLKVKLIFDPPLSSPVIESINKTINELEWRIQVQADN